MSRKVLMTVISALVLGLCAAAVLVFWPQPPIGAVTVISAPPQNEAVTPEWAVIEVFVPEDLGENLALGKEAESNGHIGPYADRNAVDGDALTYWEGSQNAYPNELTIDLGEVKAVSKLRIVLNPDPIWAARTQEIEVLGSADGETFTVLCESAGRAFDPESGGNQTIIDLGGSHEVQYVRLKFSSNTEANAGQAAEVQIY